MTAFAFVFPGQGSQAVGMLNAWEGHAAVRDTLAEASDALGEDIARLIAEGPKETLDLTTNTQPVLWVTFCVTSRAMMSVPPPAGNGTTTRMGRLGKAWAWATVRLAQAAKAASATRARRFNMGFVSKVGFPATAPASR